MFKNRQQAGKLLGEKIKEEIGQDLSVKKPGLSYVQQIVVLGIPRGGVVVAGEVAKVLDCVLDIIITKKISAPGDSELAIGAVGETNGSLYLNERIIRELGVTKEYIEEIKKIKKQEIKEKEKMFRQDRPPLNLQDKRVIIVDDGAATGSTMIAAVREVWNNKPKQVIIALPVIAQDTLAKLEDEADELLYLDKPEPFFAVGQFYEEFEQVSDEEVIRILNC